MKNLSGNKDCDIEIRKELEIARIEIVEVPRAPSEVPSALAGSVGGWKLRRMWCCWSAEPMNGIGMPFCVAEELIKRFGYVIHIIGYEGGCAIRFHIDTQEGLNVFAAIVAVLAQK